jgi:hypothetical protein
MKSNIEKNNKNLINRKDNNPSILKKIDDKKYYLNVPLDFD